MTLRGMLFAVAFVLGAFIALNLGMMTLEALTHQPPHF